MRIGIDLLWVRPRICGGTESYIRNLLEGFLKYAINHDFVLFVTMDNAESFREYKEFNNIIVEVCSTRYANPSKRILWENLYLANVVRNKKVDLMFIPVYSKPLTWGSRIPYVTVIHDLQGLHYPEYFSFGRLQFFKWCWWYTCKSSQKIIVLSDYGKEDLLRYYPFAEDKTVRIYNPILAKQYVFDENEMKQKYDLNEEGFFYCVSALLPHKNLKTILHMMQFWNGKEKLVLSGVGNQKQELSKLIEEYEIKDKIVLTGFVSDEERDWLYDHCKLFLFPSVFEGFGMPPIEAMRKGKRVVMTDKTCLREVTEGKAVYVNNPFSIEDWISKIQYALTLEEEVQKFDAYSLENVVKQYLEVFVNVVEDSGKGQ